MGFAWYIRSHALFCIQRHDVGRAWLEQIIKYRNTFGNVLKSGISKLRKVDSLFIHEKQPNIRFIGHVLEKSDLQIFMLRSKRLKILEEKTDWSY
jgi:hypothetical protein